MNTRGDIEADSGGDATEDVRVRGEVPRGGRAAVWASIVGLLTFAVVFALVAPASCGTTPDAQGKGSLPICRSVTGIAYSGSTVADFLPAVIFASTAAIPAAFGARNAVRRRSVSGRPSGHATG